MTTPREDLQVTPERWEKLKDLFDAALGRPPEERPAFLAKACEGNPSLADDVQRLLAGNDQTGNLLEPLAWIRGAILNAAGESAVPTIDLATTPGVAGGTPAIGSTFANRYEVKGELGRGGFGIVYSAFDRGPLQRTVALKVIRFASSEPLRPTVLARQRFLEEAKVAGNLSHNNIATVFDVGEFAGCVYMTQELAPGRDLRKILAESGPLPLRRIIAISRQICEALAHAHARNIVHRDIKPGNIVVGGEDRVKITDFGLAQAPQGDDDALNQAIAGTPGYMAPEQLRGERVDGRADIFAAGCVLYQMLTGRQPFEGATPASVIDKTLHAVPTEPSRVREDLPRTLDRIVGRAMRKDPDDRYAHITQLQQDLINYEQFDYLTEAKTGAAEIAAALEARQCALFLGLRLPVSADQKQSQTVERLIAEYLAEHLSSPPKERGLSRLAQELEMERGRPEMLKYLTAVVRNPRTSPRELIRRVARLPFPAIVTTGYDTCLEDELAKLNRKVRRVINCRSVPDDPAEADLLVRLFGSVDSEASIVVTEDDLWNFLGSFQSLSDALKSLFARHRLLFVGYDPEDEGFRHLFSEIARFRVGTTEGCYLATTDAVLPTVRWAQRKALRLIDADPAAFLSLLEETITERRRQKRTSQEEHYEAPLPIRPYKFLNYYDRDDERIFFGRQSETHHLLTKIHAYPLNVQYAPSGSGKTSLVCASLMPQLRRQGYTPVYCRVYDDPAGEIRRATLEAVGVPASDFPAAMPLQALLPELASRSEQRLVIFIDQFEEIFIRHDHEARDRFAASLAATLAEGKGRVRFVLSLREDFLARLSDFRERIPNIFHNEFRLAPLTETESRAAIVEPARLLGLEVDPDLVDRLIADLSREGVDPPQLQIVCDTLYDALEQGEKRITLKAYLALGETRKILGNYLERVLHDFPPAERDAARELLKSLVTSEKTKTVAQIADLARAAGRPEEEASKILSDLSNRRLIRRVQRDEGYWYELTHEYLVEEISRWLSEKEMQLKKLRELLEQAIRNHRNLGILMPAAQLRLVQAQEDDLNLSKEERQFIRESARALSTRRKNIAIAAVAAAVVLVAAVITGRYFFLRSHTFIRPEDREFIMYGSFGPLSGSKLPYRLEDIRLYRGSSNPWWIDRRLGFPRELYQTDFDLDQVDPNLRDTLKAGRMLSGGTSSEEQIFKLLQPDAQIRFLVTNGRPDEAVKSMRALYKNRSVSQGTLDDIAGLLGYSAVQRGEWIGEAIGHAFRPEATADPFASSTGALVPLLDQQPESVWRPQILPYLASPSTRANALGLIGALGAPGDAGFIKPLAGNITAEENFGMSRENWASALNGIGDCSALGMVRQMLDERELELFSASNYLAWCGDHDDIPVLKRAILRMPPNELFRVSSGIQAIYRIGGRSSIPSITQLLAQLPETSAKVDAIEGLFEPEITSDLKVELSARVPTMRAQAAAALAIRGDASGLAVAAQIASDPKQEPWTRRSAIEAFRWFKSAAIERFLLDSARTADTNPPEVRALACEALAWYNDQDTYRVLLDGLGAQDESVREAARNSLASSGPAGQQFASAKLKSLDPVRKLYAARALQLAHTALYPEVFTGFLRNESDDLRDYAATVEAIQGLRDAYANQALSVAIDALRDERREIRLAAILALASRPDPETTRELLARHSADRDPEFRVAIAKALWAVAVAQTARGGQARAESLFSQGNYRGAEQMLGRFYETGFTSGFFGMRADSYGSALKSGLSVSKTFKIQSGVTTHSASTFVFDRAFNLDDPTCDKLVAAIYTATGDRSAALGSLESLVSKHPNLGSSLAADPSFKALRDIYEFRVLTGLQAPAEVDLKLPEPSTKSP